MKTRGNLIVISGPSGSGKGTICQGLFDKIPDLHLSISATTRKPRSGEKEGINYYYLSKQEFEKKINAGQLLEWADVYGNYYGTPKEPVIEAINSGKDVVLEIDVQGALQVKSKHTDCILIFLIPPSRTELEMRLRKRGTDSTEEIEHRLKWAIKEIKEVRKYDYLVINDDIASAVEKVCAIITAERNRPALIEIEALLELYR